MDVVAVSEPTSLMIGDTAILVCVSYGEETQETIWHKNGTLLTNSSLISFYDEFTNFTLGGMPFTLSFLQICSVNFEDASPYSCLINNRGGFVSAQTQLFG